jgi:hypothetical protein
MTRPSITSDILVSSTRHGTRFTAHSYVEQKRAMREAAQSRGSGVGKVSDVIMG